MTLPSRTQGFFSFRRYLDGAGIAACLVACSSAPTLPKADADAGTDALSTCGDPAPPIYDDAPTGWASIDDLGLNGTTGGAGGEVVEVTTADDFLTQAQRVEPLEIHILGTIGDGRRLKTGSNKTILGIGERPTIQGSLEIEGVENVIVRNLYVVGNNCADDADCQGGADAVRIHDGSHHVWVDHLDVSDGSDGNLDVGGASDYVTISWTKFWYSDAHPARDHRFSNLIGSGDCAPDSACPDRGKLRVTFHHCWWADRAQERMPRARYGDVHVFNNFYSSHSNSYCIRAGAETRILAQANYFDRVSDPFDIEDVTGVIESRDNVFDRSSNTVQTGTSFTPPYAYSAEPAVNVPCEVSQGAGPH